MFPPAHPSRLSVAFTVTELFYISVNCWKLIAMQVTLAHRNVTHFYQWNATDYCPADTDQLYDY